MYDKKKVTDKCPLPPTPQFFAFVLPLSSEKPAWAAHGEVDCTTVLVNVLKWDA